MGTIQVTGRAMGSTSLNLKAGTVTKNRAGHRQIH